MFDLTSSAFWAALQKDIWKVFNYPGVEIQLYLAIVAIAIGSLLSLLILRMTKRRYPSDSKYCWISCSLLPALLMPLLIVMLLIVALWVAKAIIPFTPNTLSAFIKIALVWLGARTLLLIAQRHFMAYFVSSVMLVLALLSATNLLAPTQASLNEITFETSNFHLSLLGAIKGIFTLIVLFWGAGALSKAGEKWLHHFSLSFNARELAIKFLRIVLYAVAFILTLNEMGVNLTALTVFGGAFAVGIGFGLQKITSNFISGVILLFERTIEAGDLIEVAGEKGWVRQLAMRHTLIETSDGREMLIPNEDLITGKVTNWTYSNTRARIDISVTVVFDSDVDRVMKLLLAAARDYPQCIEDPAPTCQLREFNERGFQFMLMFWIPDIKTGTNAAKSDVMERIVRDFREHKITFARV